MPTILLIGPYRFFFVALDRGEPPHIHIERDECYAKYWLKPLQLARSVGFKPHELVKLRNLVDRHQKLFIRRWNDFFTS